MLAIVDAFILPSLGEPWGVAVIEAAFARLPLLLSNRVGCHPEALIPDKNGWLFDPQDAQDMARVIDRFLGAGAQRWADMGTASLQLAEESFATDVVVTRFLDQLVAV